MVKVGECGWSVGAEEWAGVSAAMSVRHGGRAERRWWV